MQRSQLDLIQSLNRKHLLEAEGDQAIEGLIGSYELAFRMQSTMPRIMSLDDESFGYHPVENPVHMHDLHATLLHALGLDHERLTWRHAGRDFRLTDVYGSVVHGLLA